MTTYKVNSIGTIYNNEKGAFIQLEAPYILALKELDGFSHINVLWWFSGLVILTMRISEVYWKQTSLIKKLQRKWGFSQQGRQYAQIRLLYQQ